MKNAAPSNFTLILTFRLSLLFSSCFISFLLSIVMTSFRYNVMTKKLHFSFKFNSPNILPVSYRLSVDHQRETLSLMIVLAVAVPDDGEQLSAVKDAVETEVIPAVGRY